MEFIGLIIVVFFAMFAQKYIYTKYAFDKLNYECKFSCEQAYQGDEIELIETIYNRKWLPIPWLKSEINTSKWLEFAHSQSIVTDEVRFVPSFFMVKSNQKFVRRWKVKCLKRGIYEINNITLVSTDLLGSASLSKPFPFCIKITVLPAPLESEKTQVSPKQMMGDTIIKRHLIEDPFLVSGVREYSPRDSMNKISWGATAKTGQIMVRNNDYTAQQSLCVMLNMQSREFENYEVIEKEYMEDGIRLCAHLFDSALVSGMPISFTSNASLDETRNSIITSTAGGYDHVNSLLCILSGIILKSTDVFSTFMAQIYHRITATDIALVTCFVDDEIIEFARNKSYIGVNVQIYLVDIKGISVFDWGNM